MVNWSRVAAISAALLIPCSAAKAAVAYKIVTADVRGTDHAIATDLANFVAPSADIQLEPVPTSGSAENIKLLRFEPHQNLPIVQPHVKHA